MVKEKNRRSFYLHLFKRRRHTLKVERVEVMDQDLGSRVQGLVRLGFRL